MKYFFTGISFWCAIVLLIAVGTGLGAARFGWNAAQVHILTGLFGAIFTCLVHSIVFAHLIGSGITLKDVISSNGLDQSYVKRTKRLKARSFPFALFAAMAAVAAALMGGAAYRGGVESSAHGIMAAVALVMSLVAFPFEIRVLADNTRLIREIDAIVRAQAAEAAASS